MLAGRRDPPGPAAGRREDLHTLAVAGRVGDRERAPRLDREGRRVDDAARLRTDPDDLPRARLSRIDAVDRVGGTVEDEVLPGSGLLKAGRTTEPPGEVRWNRPRRTEHIGLERRDRGHDERGRQGD